VEYIKDKKNFGGWIRQGICTDLWGKLRLLLAAMLVCVLSLGWTPVAQAYTGSITTTFAGGNGQHGNMFDVTANSANITITSFDIHVPDTNAADIEVYYKSGTYSGFENNAGAWTLLGSATVTGAGVGNPTAVNIGGLTILVKDTYGIYVTRTDGGSLEYTNGANTYSNNDITIETGVGNEYPFGIVYTPRTWNGTIYYDAEKAYSWLLVSPISEGTDIVEAYLTSIDDKCTYETPAVAGARTLADLYASFDAIYIGVYGSLSDATLQASVNGGAMEQFVANGGVMLLNLAHNDAVTVNGPGGSIMHEWNGGDGAVDDAPTITDTNHEYIRGTFSSSPTVLTDADFANWGSTVHGQVSPPPGFTEAGGANLGTSPVSSSYNEILLSSMSGTSGVTHAMIEYVLDKGYVMMDGMTYDWGTRPPDQYVLNQQLDYIRGILGNFPIPGILNGSFEAGDFSGWQTVGPGLIVYSGTTLPNTGNTVLAPPHGTYAAVTDSATAATRILYQNVAIPASGSSNLYATVYVENLAADYIIGPDLGTANPNQQMRVDIMDPSYPVDDVGNGVLLNLFQTNPGDPLSIGYTGISADLTPYAGTTVRFRVAEVDNQFFFHGAVDNVRITTSSGGGGGGGGGSGGCFIGTAVSGD
jgi:hypothetical protein